MHDFILVVDDIRFYGLFWNGTPIFYARNSASACKFINLYGRDIREFWLDHDLGGEDTILPVVKYLEECLNERSIYKRDFIVRFITSNPVGLQYLRMFADKWELTVDKNNPTMLALEPPV